MTIAFHTSALLNLANAAGLAPDSSHGLVLPQRVGFECEAPVTPRWLAELMLAEYAIELDEAGARAVLMAGRLQGYVLDAERYLAATTKFVAKQARNLDGAQSARMYDAVKMCELQLRDRPRM